MTNKQYRHGMSEANAANMIAFQIRNLREKHGLTQSQFAKKLSTRQSAIARIEDPDYGKYSIAMLHKISEVFDVALSVEFVSFSTLVKRTADLSPYAITPLSYDEEFCAASGEIFSTVITNFDNSVIDTRNYCSPVSAGESFSKIAIPRSDNYLLENK